MRPYLSQLALPIRSMHLHFALAQLPQARPYGAGAANADSSIGGDGPADGLCRDVTRRVYQQELVTTGMSVLMPVEISYERGGGRPKQMNPDTGGKI